MKIGIGTINPVKIIAVKEVLATIDRFGTADLIAINSPSGVSDQPIGLDETMLGALNRAKHAAQGNSFGILVCRRLLKYLKK